MYAKERRGADGRWCTVNLPPQHQPDVFVDDWADEAPATARLIAVSPYIAPNPHDRGLAPLLAELTAGQAGCLAAGWPRAVAWTAPPHSANGGSGRQGNQSGRSLLGARVQEGSRFSRNAATPSAESAIRPVS